MTDQSVIVNSDPVKQNFHIAVIAISGGNDIDPGHARPVPFSAGLVDQDAGARGSV